MEDRSECRICTLNQPQYDGQLVFSEGHVWGEAWRFDAAKLQKVILWYGYRNTANHTKPFLIALLVHERCTFDAAERRWKLCGLILRYELPSVTWPAEMALPFPRRNQLTQRSSFRYGKAPSDDALSFCGLPSLETLLLQTTPLPRTVQSVERVQLREFDVAALAEEVQRRIHMSRERHERHYGALFVDKLHQHEESTLQSLSQTVATREITALLGTGFVFSWRCATPSCQNPASERSHGQNHPRPALFRRAWGTVAPRHERFVPILEVMKEFLRLHLLPEVGFTLQCHACHVAQDRAARDARLAADRLMPSRFQGAEHGSASNSGSRSSTDLPPSENQESSLSHHFHRRQEDLALMNYESFHKLPRGSADAEDLRVSSAGMAGWAAYIPYDSRQSEGACCSRARSSTDPPPFEEETDATRSALWRDELQRERENQQRELSLALTNYESFYRLPPFTATIEQVLASAAGLEGWAYPSTETETELMDLD